MLEIKRGTITGILFKRSGAEGFLISIDGKEEKCIAYPELVGQIAPGDEVLVNSTAVSLNLGSGGSHYIIANLGLKQKDMTGRGHIMKMRYTPMQVKVLSVEEEDSPYHELMQKADSINGIPVLAATLHSMLAPLCIYLKEVGLRTAYIMTDGAALPLKFSQTVDWLKKYDYLCGTVTIGHSFGGDLEAVNIYSGLLAAYHVLNAEVIVVSMGPGIVGTGTRWGFTGAEQGDILNAIDTLGGRPICVPRISFADERERHKGLSHHTLTVLDRICRSKATVPIPWMEKDKLSYVMEQLRRYSLLERYDVCMEESRPIIDMIAATDLKITTMGRGIEQEQEFFLALGAAAMAAEKLQKGLPLQVISLA